MGTSYSTDSIKISVNQSQQHINIIVIDSFMLIEPFELKLNIEWMD